MKLFTYSDSVEARLGLAVGGRHYDLATVILNSKEFKGQTKPKSFADPVDKLDMIDLITFGCEGLEILRSWESYIVWNESEGDPMVLRNARLDGDAINWLPPVVNPPVLYGIGGNSPLFFRTKDFQIPAYPRGFMRPTNSHALVGHNGRVEIPSHYETMRASAEMGVVIGRRGQNVIESEAMNYVFGYTLVNDMCSDSWKAVALGELDETEMHRDLTVFTQRAATSYYSRSTDTFAAIGPWIVTKDEVPDPYNLMVWNRLSGIQRERAYTQAMVNSIERTVAFLSRIFELRPGMIFHMGTMGIDGFTLESDMLLGPNDYFEIEYERIGSLRCYVNDGRGAK